MLSFLLRRLLQLLPVLFGVSTLVFLLLHLVPGDPVDIMLGESSSTADRAELRHSMHLDESIPKQYGLFLGGIIQGDLGKSFLSKRPVAELIRERLLPTFSLAFAAILWALLLAIPLGVLSASFRDSLFDKGVLFYSILGISLPSFWFGPLLVLLFSIKLGWFPVSELQEPSSYVLPSLTLGLSLSAVLTRMTRASMLEVLRQNYITTARSRGLSWAVVHFRHALKNALIPVITIIGLQLGSLLAGTVITETIFDWPGIGELVYRAIQSRDYPLVQGCVLVIALTYVCTNILADIAYTLANPRLELS